MIAGVALRNALDRLSPPPRGVVSGSRLAAGGDCETDVAIVTNCAFPGGNGATTLTEYGAFERMGVDALIVHCPVKRSPWKRTWLAERYLPFQDRIVPAHRVRRLRCRTLIVRGPRMIMTPAFHALARRIRAERVLFVVNNSAWSEAGKAEFDWPALHRLAANFPAPRCAIYPISPLMRRESQRALAGSGAPDRLAEEDWPPAFDLDQFAFAPRATLSPPVAVGRHARDHPGKWLEDDDALRAAYPERRDIVIRILGGAATVERRLGALPSNWSVQPFGPAGVREYLAGLDIFAYFPASARDEAFGRTIVEAVLSGLPVILPPRFAETFGDLALYCEPQQVARVIEELAADDAGRLRFVEAARHEAAARYGTGRLADLRGVPSHAPALDEDARRFRRQVMPPATE